jgi:Zn-dependent peptidase ImmA (M78 family)
MCIPNKVTEDDFDEFEINNQAGTILLPDDVITPTNNPDEIYKYSKKLKVSSEVYLRRLKSLHLIDNDTFFELLEIIRSNVKPPKKGGVATQLQKCINSRGQLFFDTVINAAQNDIISYARATDALGIKVNYLLSS